MVSLGYTDDEIVFILFFYLLGGILGYFAFKCKYDQKILTILFDCTITALIGMFLAYILANYLEENKVFSKPMNILIGGLGSFGLPDIVITYFPTLKKLVGREVLKKFHKESANNVTKQ